MRPLHQTRIKSLRRLIASYFRDGAIPRIPGQMRPAHRLFGRPRLNIFMGSFLSPGKDREALQLWEPSGYAVLQAACDSQQQGTLKTLAVVIGCQPKNHNI